MKSGVVVKPFTLRPARKAELDEVVRIFESFLNAKSSRSYPEIESFLGRPDSSKECVVADAVAIEPVSASQFPANREKNREICNSGAASPNRWHSSPNDFGAFCPNSLLVRTGNSAK